MKRTTKLAILSLSLAFILSGCYLKSVHPLVTKKDLVLVPGLEGRWENEDQRWTFVTDFQNIPDVNADVDDEGKPEKVYLVIFEDLESPETDTTLFTGSIGEFSGYYFLDLYILEAAIGEGPDDFRDIHYFPVHTFSKIGVTGNELSIEFFKDDWIKSLIEDNRVRIKHEKVNDNVLITASTKELQKFVTKYADDRDAYDDPLQLNRNR